MTRRRVGLWLVGAFGGVGTTITLGLAAMARGLSDRTGLVTELPEFRELPLPEPADFVVGGHDIRQTIVRRVGRGVPPELGRLRRRAGSPPAATSSPPPRPGSGPAPGSASAPPSRSSPTGPSPSPVRTARQAVDLIAADLAAFAKAEADRPPDRPERRQHRAPVPPRRRPSELGRRSSPASPTGAGELLPSSSLYALAAIEAGHTYINFTPSLGASIPALAELAEATGSLLAGKDGKTGETLMKTVLAPMFAHRNLKVMSWVGHNIFGNRDGLILDDPTNKASKVETKDRVITEILGYKPASLVTIEYIPDMGDWKTAWDHIHFQGFLGTKMTLQFTWQGCDSLLAAPLAIDLARLADLEKRRGGKGLMRHLACFFKSPEGVEENDFFKQFEAIRDYLGEVMPPTMSETELDEESVRQGDFRSIRLGKIAQDGGVRTFNGDATKMALPSLRDGSPSARAGSLIPPHHLRSRLSTWRSTDMHGRSRNDMPEVRSGSRMVLNGSSFRPVNLSIGEHPHHAPRLQHQRLPEATPSTRPPRGSRRSATRGWSSWPTSPTPGRPGCSTGPKRAIRAAMERNRAGVLERQRVHDERDHRPSPAVLVSVVHRARPALPPGPDRPHPAGPRASAPSWARRTSRPSRAGRSPRASRGRRRSTCSSRSSSRWPSTPTNVRRPAPDRARAGPAARDDRPVPGGRRAGRTPRRSA